MLNIMIANIENNNKVTILYDVSKIRNSEVHCGLVLDIDVKGNVPNRNKGYISKYSKYWQKKTKCDVISSGKIKINSSDEIKLYEKDNGDFIINNKYNSSMLISNNSIIETGNSYSHNYKEIPYIILELGK